jgi:hypothetical protein
MITKERLEGQKKVIIFGHQYTIRKVNPLLDFHPDKMPSVFSSFQSRRKAGANAKSEMSDPHKVIEDMMMVVKAGLVCPELVDDSAKGITIKDIFRDPDTGASLYVEIIGHSLMRLSGAKKVFFYLLNRLF